MPIFVPLDKMSRKNLGHQIANLKELSEWNESFTRSQVKAMGAVDDFFERVRQELADRVGVDVAKVDFNNQPALKDILPRSPIIPASTNGCGSSAKLERMYASSTSSAPVDHQSRRSPGISDCQLNGSLFECGLGLSGR